MKNGVYKVGVSSLWSQDYNALYPIIRQQKYSIALPRRHFKAPQGFEDNGGLALTPAELSVIYIVN